MDRLPQHDAEGAHLRDQPQDPGSCAEAGDDFREDDLIEWTPERVQAVREANYVTFDGVDETDYTRGPVRMVQAADGVVCCTALLLTLDLSKAIQKAIKAERDYLTSKSIANEQTEALLRFESTIGVQIASHRSRLTMPGPDGAKNRAPEAELSTLELMLEEYKLERTAIQNNLQYKGDQLRKLQSKVNTTLEDAWVDAQLLDTETEAEKPEEVKDYDLQTEYRRFQQKMRSADQEPPLADDDAAGELDTSEDHLHVDVAMTEAEEVNQAVWDAWDRLQAAQEQFDDRDDARERAERARREALERGDEVEDSGSEVFDLRWLVHERSLTRALIDAEEAYQAAQEAAKDGDADDLRPYEVSESAGSGEDGHSSSLDHSNNVASAPKTRIQRWLADLPSPPQDPEIDLSEPMVEVDDWEAVELDVGDSISAIIEAEAAGKRNPMRRKIEQWTEVERSEKGVRIVLLSVAREGSPAFSREHANSCFCWVGDNSSH